MGQITTYYQDILALCKEGLTVTEMYKRLGEPISKQRICKLKQEILSDHPELVLVYEEKKRVLIEKIIELAHNNYTIAEIGFTVGLSASTISNILKTSGCKKPRAKKKGAKRKKSDHYETIYQMVSQGYRVSEIEKALKCLSRQRTSQIRHQILALHPEFQQVYEQRISKKQ